jgi:hypothetical protein
MGARHGLSDQASVIAATIAIEAANALQAANFSKYRESGIIKENL